MSAKKIIIWAAGAAFTVGAFYLLSSRPLSPADTPETPTPPSYSLAPGPLGMVSGISGYDLSPGGPFTEEQVMAAILNYLDQRHNPDLALGELREFTWAYQAEILERSTGKPAFGLMIGKNTGWISPKPGPNLFWNTSYGPELAWIGGGYGMQGRLVEESPIGDPIPPETAFDQALSSIRSLEPDLHLAPEPRAFPGYFEFLVLSGGEAIGEIDVNAYSGQVWYTRWDSAALSVREFEIMP